MINKPPTCGGFLLELIMNKITKEFLESEIKEVKYTRIGERITHCSIIVKCGFIFTGESAVVDANNFDEEIGKKIAYENAFEKMWMPYGFTLMRGGLE